MHKLQQVYQVQHGSSKLCVMATGGGAYKYYDDIKNTLGVEVLREDEMECLVLGQSAMLQALEVCANRLFQGLTFSSLKFPKKFSHTLPKRP